MVHPGPRLLPTLLWPALLSAAFVFGLLVSVLWVTAAEKDRPRVPARRYFEPRAVCEAVVAILSGVLLWMGFWDFIDEYLVPKEWWAKLCMLIVGGLGLFATRTLYDEQTLLAIRGEEEQGTGCGVSSGEVEMEAALPTADEAAAASVLEAVQPPLFATREEGGKRRRRTGCFDPPRFSCSRCSRALAATFSGLTLWVGIWDLLDAHMLPELVVACDHEPSTECALVKLLLIVVGALGLYCTRSLYGDSAPGSVQFQRIQ